ncbi:MAG TPA: hypothetical protein PLY93_09165 [Turneriella sp.]|nr:hypothetical protein [Turneriella sp.]
MHKIIILFISFSLLHAATVITTTDRFTGTITAKTQTSLTMRDEDSVTHQIDRSHILKIMDDDGNVVYTAPSLAQDAALPPPLPSAAVAPPPPPQQYDEGSERHDGFFLRMLGGWGSYSFLEKPVYTDGTGRIELSSLIGFFNLQLGVAVVDNFILHGSLSGYSSTDISEGKLDGTTQAFTNKIKANISVIGAGFTYYIMPINLYFGAEVGRATTTITNGSVSFTSEAGVAFNLYIGKEWWVSKNWGLGAALFYHYSTMPDSASGSVIPQITNTVIGIAFSATYN